MESRTKEDVKTAKSQKQSCRQHVGRNQQRTDGFLEPAEGSVHPRPQDSDLQPYVMKNVGFSILPCSCSMCCYGKPTYLPLRE